MRSTTVAVTTARFCLSLLAGGSRFGTALASAILLAALSGVPPLASAQTITFANQTPGPSQALFNSPYYTCETNYYVSSTGSDSNPGMQAAPWATLQHANDSLPSVGAAAGTCINVEPGTYASGVTITNGGNLASATSYVVYRCTTMDACKITASGFATDAFRVNSTNWSGPDYIIIDGFNIAAASSDTYGVGVTEADPTNPGGGGIATTHHFWVLNSIIHGYGQAGINPEGTDYQYYLHNTIYDNANNTCDAQGSGISIVVPKDFPNYTPTADDKTNPNPLIGTFVNGSSYFHNVIEWNIVYNNALTQCGTASNAYDTDGNGIILDTFLTRSDGSGNTVDYPDSSLVAFNVSYNNGGGGIHIFEAQYVTVANNTVYNNYLDPGNGGSSRGNIDESDGGGDTYINNITYSMAAPKPSGSQCFNDYGVVPYTMWNSAILGSPRSGLSADTFSHNLSYLVNADSSCQGEISLSGADIGQYSSANNQENTDPLWTSVGNTSTGSETTPPVGADFTLQAGSPAIGYALSEPYLPGITDDGAYQSGVPVTAPTVSLSASPTSITSGQSSTLTWSSTNTTSCTGTGFTASDTSGSASVSPTQTTTYSITCTGANGSTQASASVAIASAAPPPSTTPPSKSSGGAMGWLELLLIGALAGLSGARRRRALNGDPDIDAATLQKVTAYMSMMQWNAINTWDYGSQEPGP